MPLVHRIAGVILIAATLPVTVHADLADNLILHEPFEGLCTDAAGNSLDATTCLGAASPASGTYLARSTTSLGTVSRLVTLVR